ncbi:hypothetical protein [Wolbachia endosymbiont (group B) of Hofmannophila pseudospretella]|uniref:hypothetical protein n=1 Tax=Wolbachia endosymbiont (group B) of Hofmannophila pseudospretella TaxID=3066177 RepID=UPI003341CBF7
MPSNTKPLELIQLLLMENTSKDKFFDFQERFQSFINQSPSFLHSVGKEGFFPSFFFGMFATMLDTELATKADVKKLYFRFDDDRTLKIVVLTSKKELKCITISDRANDNKHLRFSKEELEKIKQAIGEPLFDDYKKEEHEITITGKEVRYGKIDPAFSEKTDHSEKNFTKIEKTQDQQNLENLISKLNNQDSEEVKKNAGEVFDYITDVYKKYEKEKVPFSSKESSYHGFLSGFLMNFKYRFHLKLYLELFAGKGYADVVLLVRGADKSSNSVPIIIELKAGTGKKSRIEVALKQAQDYVKGYFSNAIRMITTANKAICVGLNFEMIDHGNVAIDVESFLDRKGNSVVEKLLDNPKKGERAIAELTRKQLEYLYYGTVWSNGGSSNLHYMSRVILGQLMLIPDINEKGEELGKYIYIYKEDEKMAKGTRSRTNLSANESIKDCVITTVLTIGGKVFILHVNEVENTGVQIPENKRLNIERLNGIKEVHRVNCNLYGTPSNQNSFDQYCNKEKGTVVKIYPSLGKYQENRGVLQGNLLQVSQNNKFKAALKQAIESGQYDDYKRVFTEVSHMLYSFKSLINNEADFQAVLHGLFSSYSDGNIRVITEFQIGGGEKLDIMMVVQVIGKEHPPIGIELKFAKPGKLNSKIKEADDQLERYQKGEAYKVVTDANEVELMYAVFNQGATNKDDLIRIGDKFVDLKAKHSSDTMMSSRGSALTGNVQQSVAQKAGPSRAVNR